MKKRQEFNEKKDAMSIYELHPGSWKKHPLKDGDEDGFYNYRELAHSLADYVKEMGYTHVELMGIAEHPLTVPGDIRLQDIMHPLPGMVPLRTSIFELCIKIKSV